MTEANTCSTCGKSKVADPASPDAHCKGHADTGASMKAALDAIKTPGSPAAAAAKPAPAPVPAPKPSSSQQNIKSALDAIPTPGSGKTSPAPVPAPAAAKAEPSLADQLNAIPTPGQKSAASVSRNQLDAIPTPGSGAAPSVAAGGSQSFADQLNAIPTPGVNSTAGINANDLNAIPTPGSRPQAAPQKPPGEQPQWMKNYNQYQSAMTSSSASGLPVQDPNANYQFQNRDLPANNNSGYMMIAVLVVIIVLGFFGFTMMSKTPPPNFDGSATGTSTSSPSSTLPGTPVTPQQPVISQPVGNGYTPPPPTEPSVVQP